MPKPKQSWKEINGRKSQRYAEFGREQELLVETFLRDAKDGEENLFIEVVRTEPNSPEDEQGCDFIVKRKVNDLILERAFGITISQKRRRISKGMHDAPQFYVPIGFNTDRFLKKILDLFESTQ